MLTRTTSRPRPLMRGALLGLVGLLGAVALAPLPEADGAEADAVRAPSVCDDTGPIRARDLAAAGSARVACDLTGRTITSVDGLAVQVPPMGETVTAHVVRADGPPSSLTVRNDAGHVTATRQPTTSQPTEPSSAPPSRRSQVGGPACRDSRYAFGGSTWHTPLNWRFHGRTTPRRFSRDAVRQRLMAAAASVARGRNDCGMKGLPDAYQVYRGSAEKAPDIDADGRCTTSDPVSSIGFGRLGPGRLAVTCIWSRGGRSYTADVRIAPRGDLVLRIPDRCRGRYDLQSFMTHEFGTIFGLANVESRTLTMGAYVLPCTDRLRSLGRGDVLGMRALYGER